MLEKIDASVGGGMVLRYIVSFILIYNVHRNVGLSIFYDREKSSDFRTTVTLQILRNILIRERYRSIHFSKFQRFTEAMFYHLRINDSTE